MTSKGPFYPAFSMILRVMEVTKVRGFNVFPSSHFRNEEKKEKKQDAE